MSLSKKITARIPWATTAFRGELQRLLGQPITQVGTHRQALEQCLQRLRVAPEIKGRVAITALRNESWIGVAVYTACVLRQMGYESTLLYRGSEVRRFFPASLARFDFWKGVSAIPGIELVDLESIEATEAEEAEFTAAAERAAGSAVAYDLHLEEDDIVHGDAELVAARDRMVRHMSRMAAVLKKALQRGKYHRLLLYSGLIAESATMLECARRLGQETVCLEGWAWRHGHMISNRNAPALDYDVEGWVRRIQPWDRAKEQEIDRYINFLDGRYTGGSEWLDNFYSVQRAEISKTLPPGLREFVAGPEKIFLLAPNVIGDSSMLQRETIFASQRKWLRAVVDYFRARPHLKLIVRAHPAEVWVQSKVRIKMADAANEYAAGVPNIHVIAAEEKLNTFTLLPFIHGGLVWLSSAGVDMVVRGIPVISGARPKYTGLGIVEEPASQADYFALLERWSAGPPRPTAQQILAAKQYLYVVFKGFSFEAWSKNTYITGCRLNEMPNQAEHDAFYRELVS